MTARLLLASALLGASAAAAIAQTAAPPVYVQPLTPAAVKLVQDHLRRTGDYAGRADGVWGADSQAALEHFQQTHGLQATGQLNQATVATLGLSPSDVVAMAAPPAAAPAPSAAVTPAAIRAVQARLRDLNFYGGGADGIMGAETQAAIERFQQGRGLPANGQINPATVAALGLDPNGLLAQTSR